MRLRVASLVLLLTLSFSATAAAAPVPWPPPPGSADARIYVIIQKVTELIGRVTTLEGQVGALGTLTARVQALEDTLADVIRTGSLLFLDGVNLSVEVATGSAGHFEITSSTSNSCALDVETSGIGAGICVDLTNAANGARGIDVLHAGIGPGIFSSTTGGTAVWGVATAISAAGVIGDNDDGEAVVGRNRGGVGVGAVVGRNDDAGYGVRGFNTSTGIGVLGQGGISGGTGPGGRFEVVNAASAANALEATTAGTGNAGYFAGNVQVTGDLNVGGTLTKGAGAFRIDHPLDPENRYLYHSFVESPDMMNVYNGVVRLDDAGEAWVEMPAWFEALNRDFRYQLTPIGAPGPDLYVAEEVQGNRFKVAGGRAGGKVSWQVTGVRQDPYANAHRVPVEETKPEEARGRRWDDPAAAASPAFDPAAPGIPTASGTR